MSVTESKRFQLHLALKEVLGDKMADTLIDHLPPTGWADVARKDDLNKLERQLDRQFTSLERRMSVGLTTGLAFGLALLAIQVQILLTIAR